MIIKPNQTIIKKGKGTIKDEEDAVGVWERG